MAPFAYALLARVHGHLGWIGVALLLHPVLFLGRPGGARRARPLAWAAVALLTVQSALGAAAYPAYRQGPKRLLLQHALGAAQAFEVKEHLAFCALVLAWGGALALDGHPRAARALLAGAAACGVAVGLLGVLVGAAVRAAGG
jgi:hypothetical protein